MYTYSLKGRCPDEREKAFSAVENIIRNHGLIVAFSKPTETSINLIIEVKEQKLESLISYLGKYMSLSEINASESAHGINCKVLVNMFFSN
jgi:predicted nucleic-acid-binding protein